MNELGGYRNDIAIALTGLDVDAKARVVEDAFWAACPHTAADFASVVTRVVRTDKPDPATNEEATALWRISVKDPDERKVGRAFSNAVIETALASIPGMYGVGGGPSAASPYGVYRPALIDAGLVPLHVHVDGLAEPPCQRPMMLVLDRLIAEEQHLVLEQPPFEGGKSGIVDRLAQIDATHLGTERTRQGLKRDHVGRRTSAATCASFALPNKGRMQRVGDPSPALGPLPRNLFLGGTRSVVSRSAYEKRWPFRPGRSRALRPDADGRGFCAKPHWGPPAECASPARSLCGGI
jgi:hypothetical protein